MRKPRILISDKSYHITARANRQEFILNSVEMKELLLRTIKRAKKKYKFKLKNFCIMGNHIHLIIKPSNKSSLSKIMQWILSVFAMRFNKKYGFIGHVWYDRFKSKVIESFKQYLRTFFYIADNPVRANIVNKSINYKYNGVSFIKNGDFDIIERPNKIIMDMI